MLHVLYQVLQGAVLAILLCGIASAFVPMLIDIAYDQHFRKFLRELFCHHHWHFINLFYHEKSHRFCRKQGTHYDTLQCCKCNKTKYKDPLN